MSNSQEAGLAALDGPAAPALTDRVVLTVAYLVDRAVHPADDARARHETRWRFAAVRRVSPAERLVAAEMRALRLDLAQRLQGVRACANCSGHRPRPEGAWRGGQCCAGETAALFTEDECAALAASGVGLRALRVRPGPRRGCVFRAEDGCVLATEARPNVCLRYLCAELERELSATGTLAEVQASIDRLSEAFARFTTLRRARLERDAEQRWQRALAGDLPRPPRGGQP